MARPYTQRKRSETAEETRRRIVLATFELHGEQGIAATSMKQIAERAGVSVGAVYHHFPTLDEAVGACGAFALSHSPFPTREIFDGAAGRPERVRRLAQACFATFAGVRAFGSVLADQDKLPILRGFVAEEQAVRRTLAALAIEREGAPAETLAALVDFGVYDAFKRMGFPAPEAAERAAAVANAWLESCLEETP